MDNFHYLKSKAKGEDKEDPEEKEKLQQIWKPTLAAMHKVLSQNPGRLFSSKSAALPSHLADVCRQTRNGPPPPTTYFLPDASGGLAVVFFGKWRQTQGGVRTADVVLRAEQIILDTDGGMALWLDLSMHPSAHLYFTVLYVFESSPWDPSTSRRFVWSAMERLEGTLESKASRPPWLQRAVVEKMITAVAVLHAGNLNAGDSSQGRGERDVGMPILHADIKPETFLVKGLDDALREGESGGAKKLLVKLSDFLFSMRAPPIPFPSAPSAQRRANSGVPDTITTGMTCRCTSPEQLLYRASIRRDKSQPPAPVPTNQRGSKSGSAAAAVANAAPKYEFPLKPATWMDLPALANSIIEVVTNKSILECSENAEAEEFLRAYLRSHPLDEAEVDTLPYLQEGGQGCEKARELLRTLAAEEKGNRKPFSQSAHFHGFQKAFGKEFAKCVLSMFSWHPSQRSTADECRALFLTTTPLSLSPTKGGGRGRGKSSIARGPGGKEGNQYPTIVLRLQTPTQAGASWGGSSWNAFWTTEGEGGFVLPVSEYGWRSGILEAKRRANWPSGEGGVTEYEKELKEFEDVLEAVGEMVGGDRGWEGETAGTCMEDIS
uniref:Protein kinase domain-containing protein n=1 Tax=Chromera velia CCMP2878 TaxID=1169474 RepID=A0A0G4GD19_9ALVE|eukprot:Cvel_21355.t1-p1 / transcript=Cvel_21355.t1 / gene=Cvel_21355 / organism=Chromera_velia_CCMP2878 / gene_product=hypothetical protein / transcript_product=hypothetical protein / location=Cvel_scaffold1995:6437-30082(-) / protein_length=604 / sequence_SO=supercontig / SO=protein_coding / is_pseudo=false